jgi:hypothetical protein
MAENRCFQCYEMSCCSGWLMVRTLLRGGGGSSRKVCYSFLVIMSLLVFEWGIAILHFDILLINTDG